MIRDDYDEALRDIDAYHTEGERNSVIISGHSGIGIIMGSVGQAFTYIYSTLSRQDYPIVLHFGQASSRRKANHPSEQHSIPYILPYQRGYIAKPMQVCGS